MAQNLRTLTKTVDSKLTDAQKILEQNQLAWRSLLIALLASTKEDLEVLLEVVSPKTKSKTDRPVSILKIKREQAQVRLANIIALWNKTKINLGNRPDAQIQNSIHLVDELVTCLQMGQ